jgi:murein L,D-transpeptidase YafK
VANVKVRNKPKNTATVITTIRNNFWFEALKIGKYWTKIKLNNNKNGYIKNKYITNIWIKVFKAERKLYLMKNNKVLAGYPVGLGFNPIGDKVKYGDGCTPNGRFYIVEMLKNPKPTNRYGARSIKIPYPNLEDARRGLRNKLINKKQYDNIVKATYYGKTPPQNTKLDQWL